MAMQSSFPVIVALSVTFAFISVSLLLLSWVFSRQKLKVHQRAVALMHGGHADAAEQSLWGVKTVVNRLGHRFGDRLSALDSEVSLMLAQAGWRGREAKILFSGLQVFLPLTAAALVGFSGLSWSLPGLADQRLLLVLFAACTLGYLMPKFILRILVKARKRRLAREVPVFVDLLRVFFDVGLGTDQALVAIAGENKRVLPDLSDEIEVVLRQVAVGGERAQAMREMARVLDVPELTDMVALLGQIDQYGGSVQQPILQFAELLQDRRRTELQEKVTKLSAKMTIVMVLFMFPALMIISAGPGFLATIRALKGF
ncbi:MAG: type II secretion system F family protein [Candidatus Binatia bacterium]